jgi:uncharacterized membrane-anchored protein YjiN (DUF445 family)
VIPSAAAIANTKTIQAWKILLKLSFELSHSPGVAKATGTVTTRANDIKTNKAVNAVIINFVEVCLYDDTDDQRKIEEIKDYLFLMLIEQLLLDRLT